MADHVCDGYISLCECMCLKCARKDDSGMAYAISFSTFHYDEMGISIDAIASVSYSDTRPVEDCVGTVLQTEPLLLHFALDSIATQSAIDPHRR